MTTRSSAETKNGKKNKNKSRLHIEKLFSIKKKWVTILTCLLAEDEDDGNCKCQQVGAILCVNYG